MIRQARRRFLTIVGSAAFLSVPEVARAAIRYGQNRSEGAVLDGEQDQGIRANSADHEVATRLKPLLKSSRARIEQFFDAPFAKPYEVVIHPNRSEFDRDLREHYRIPETQRWMVALGVADRMVLLSLRVWKTEAVEHNPEDDRHLAELVCHELVHVYHGQNCPRPDFDGMDDLGWFVEGLAVLVSGQLDEARRARAIVAAREGRAPRRLADAWSGRDRYGISGSMADFVDRKYGRATLRKLLAVTTNDQAMRILETDEPGFLAAWKADLIESR